MVSRQTATALRLVQRCLVLAVLGLLGGCGTPSFLVTPVSSSSTLQEITVREGQGFFQPKIAMIEVEGMLANAESGGFLRATENPVSLFAQQLHQAEKDPSVAAIVLRVNSPGGTVTASDTMYQLVKRYKKATGKPVIAAGQEVMASGAYYVSCAADKIVVSPTTVVGSIGVVYHTFDASGAMAKIGLRSEAIKSGPLKDMGSPLHPLSDPERRIMQGMIDEYHGNFLAILQAGRPIKDQQTLQLVTDGRVFSGAKAVTLGLADTAGQLEDAIELAKKTAKSPKAKVIMYKRPYGYSGSIYASGPNHPPQSTVLQLNLPPSRATLATGFYYLWQP